MAVRLAVPRDVVLVGLGSWIDSKSASDLRSERRRRTLVGGGTSDELVRPLALVGLRSDLIGAVDPVEDAER